MKLEQPQQNDGQKGIESFLSKLADVVKRNFDHPRLPTGILLALLSAVCFSVANTLYYISGSCTHPINATMWSSMSMVVSSSIIMILIRPRMTTSSKEILIIIAVAFVGSCGTLLEVIAIVTGHPADATALYSTLPVFLLILEAIVNRMMPRFVPFCLAFLTVVGVVFVAQPQFLFHQIFSTTMTTFASFALSGTVFFGFYFLGVRKLQTLDIHSSLIILSYSCLLLLLSFILCLYFDKLTLPAQCRTVVIFVSTGILSISGYWFTVLALKIEQASYVSMFLTSEVAFAYFLQYLVLKVHFNWLSMFGGAIIAVACVGIALTKHTPDDTEGRNEGEPLIE